MTLSLLTLMFGCSAGKRTDDTSGEDNADLDWDGFAAIVDCNDEDPLIYPGATEICDGTDNDCNGIADDNPVDMQTFYLDEDEDGAGADGTGVASCDQPKGTVLNQLDCDDTDPDRRPGLSEVCDDKDNDCDGDIDEEALDATYFYRDADGDGYGSPNTEVLFACQVALGFVESPEDCDDGDPEINPEATEVCDPKGMVDEDCDGFIDDEDESVENTTEYYEDLDEDGHGDPKSPQLACVQPQGYADLGDDCDDEEVDVHPDLAERCGDGLDNDCDGNIDEPGEDTPVDWYEDDDGDGFGDPTGFLANRCDTPGSAASNPLDCDDAANSVNPDATETWYDGVDADCDGLSDYDQDLDGFDADGWGADCDDVADTINPAMPEGCGDGIDNDCDGVPDDCNVIGWIYGNSTGDNLGTAVAHAGDVTGDGVDDLLVGADGVSSVGAAYVIAGPVTATGAVKGLGLPITGKTALDWVGGSVAGLGDLDGDGIDEMVIGARGLDNGGADAGGAFLFYGPITGSAKTVNEADVIIEGEGADDLAGWRLAAVGDVTSDGVGDILISALGKTTAGPEGGAVYIVSGVVSGTVDLVFAQARLLGDEGGDWAGFDVADAGDTNGDGVADIVVGAPYATGAQAFTGLAAVFYGPITGTHDLAEADARILGVTTGDLAGNSVAGLGDTNGDGRDDLGVGAPEADNEASGSGSIYVLAGPVAGDVPLTASMARIDGAAPGDSLGSDLVGGGDFDQNSQADLVVGARFDDTAASDAGTASLFLGPLAGTWTTAQADAVAGGLLSGGQAGASIAMLPDLDGDGGSDVLVGVPLDDTTASTAGAAMLLTFSEAE